MKDFTGRYKKSKKFYPLYKSGKFSLPPFLKEGWGGFKSPLVPL
jgi:hypothetical protein